MPYKNKEDERRNKKEYYLKNREIILARASAWNKKHTLRVKEIRDAYNQRQKNFKT